jgi:hypothetical protein
VPFSYADVRPYAVAGSLDELRGPEHGAVELPRELAWSGRRRFDLDDDYDRAAVDKIILEEGREEHFRRAWYCVRIAAGRTVLMGTG